MTFIKSVEKAVDILSCFTIETPVLTVGEITRMTGLNQSTVSRLLATLALKKCVEQTGPAGQYCLGVKFYQWGSVLRQKVNVADLARPVMERLRDVCGEEVSLYALSEGNRICLEAVKSRHGLAKVTVVGKILPLHCGAAGKVLLAYLPDKERKKILNWKPLEKFTPSTITDPVFLEADLERIRGDGYAVSVGEREEGAYSVVAPVMDEKGKIVASLSISGPIFRLSEEQKAANIQAILKAAREITALLGGADGKLGKD
ncbi:MAG: IclR family transcriptional regulator [Proteobacteria bacterium]|nr:IclR family transcriptional regulator [Pseudomonadota bacterium]MBU2227165.1 IclR family transcriptional regulator [Pseudomonadota bacterium]MBU2260730.1 IclR family transcriptional regulator [Pseudomonadota bacterium]